jgi:hypothetical protein
MQKLLQLTILPACAVFILISGCDNTPDPGPEIHDTKFRAVDATGQVLDISIAPGECVYDDFTHLTWEVKRSEAGLQSSANTYSWYDPNESHDGELDYRGLPNGGECTGSDCDTSSYVDAINATALCSFNDWRMPTRDELGSISDPRRIPSPPSINSRYFPNTQAGEYWSGNDYQFQYDAAWVWSFEIGLDRVEWKRTPRYLRLVRGEPVQVMRVKD